jgi:hypothetical protein
VCMRTPFWIHLVQLASRLYNTLSFISLWCPYAFGLSAKMNLRKWLDHYYLWMSR